MQFRGEFAQFRAETNDRFARLEELARKQRRDTAGMLVMMKGVAGRFDERVSDREARFERLERAPA